MHTSGLDCYILPDFFSFCTYPLQVNLACENAARASEQWLLSGANFDRRQREVFFGLKAGELAASCFPDANPFRLRICCDVINYFFNLNSWAYEFDPSDLTCLPDCVLSALDDPYGYHTDKIAGILAKDFYALLSFTAGIDCLQRFVRAMELFFTASQHEAMVTDIPDLESYVHLRRNSSGCKPCFVLIEYANGIDLPNYVMEHPIIRALEEAANDIITWSNDILSFNIEQARGDTRNMVTVLINHHGLDLQEAVDYVADLCKASIARFENDRSLVPSFDPQIDKLVVKYVEGLQHWIAASLHWSFDTERYFGMLGAEVKLHRVVRLSSSSHARR